MISSVKAEDIWFKEVKPFIEEVVLLQCQSDDILTDKLIRAVRHVDCDILDGKPFATRVNELSKVLTSESYYENSPLRKATQTERDLVRQLGEKFVMLDKIERSQQPVQAPNKPEPTSQRLPNRETDVTDMYKRID